MSSEHCSGQVVPPAPSAPAPGGWDGGSSWQPPPADQKKVFAGNLPMDIREDEVRTIFGTYGTITDVTIIDGKPPGSNKCAFVSYDADQGAATAIQAPAPRTRGGPLCEF